MFAASYDVDVVDTTGAGDSFIGAFLYKLLESDKALCDYRDEELITYLKYANLYAGYTTSKVGALAAMASSEEFIAFQETYK